jgi:restriction system protein
VDLDRGNAAADPRLVEVLPFGSRRRSTRGVGHYWAASPERPFELEVDELFSVCLKPAGAPEPPIVGTPDGTLGPFPLKACPFCRGSLRYSPEVARLGWIEWRRGDAIQCEHCRWWVYVWTKAKFYPFEHVHNVAWEATVCEFDYADAEQPLIALREQLATGAKDPRDLTPRGLERLVTSVFRDWNGVPARHVGRSGDGGIDVLLLDGNPPLAIQVKRRAYGGTEGPAVIRDLVGALAYRGWRRGAVVTTAETFSAQAEETTDAVPLDRDGYEIDLYAYDALRELVAATAPPERPWLDLIFPHYLDEADLAEVERRAGTQG